jgi:hypothetical protein
MIHCDAMTYNTVCSLMLERVYRGHISEWYLPFYLYAQGAPGFLRSQSAKTKYKRR